MHNHNTEYTNEQQQEAHRAWNSIVRCVKEPQDMVDFLRSFRVTRASYVQTWLENVYGGAV